MQIKILGTGCDKCKKVQSNTEKAIKELGIEASLEKVEDLVAIMKYGVMSTPAVVIEGKVVSVGKVLTTDQIKKILMDFKI